MSKSPRVGTRPAGTTISKGPIPPPSISPTTQTIHSDVPPTTLTPSPPSAPSNAAATAQMVSLLESLKVKLDAVHTDIKDMRTDISTKGVSVVATAAVVSSSAPSASTDNGSSGRRAKFVDEQPASSPQSSPSKAAATTTSTPSDTGSGKPAGRTRGVKIGGEEIAGSSVSPTQSALSPNDKQPPGGTAFSLGGERAGREKTNSGGAASSSNAATIHTHDSRKVHMKVKQKQKEFFEPMLFNGEWNDVPVASGVKCVWMACAAMGIDYCMRSVDDPPLSLDNPQFNTIDPFAPAVRIEDLLRNNKMALHYVSFPSVTLAELYDTIDEFLTTAPVITAVPKYANHLRCEVSIFDSSTVEDAGDELGTGERLPMTSLAMFRKELAQSLNQSDSFYIFNYDPFIVQENEVKGSGGSKDENDDENATSSPKKPVVKQWKAKNQGEFGVLTSFNPALHTVTLAIPHLAGDGTYKLVAHQCSLQTLYQACCAKDGYSKRSRGFVRIFVQSTNDGKTSNGVVERVPTIFPISLIDGRDANGMLSIALDIAIAPHLLALAIFHHIVRSTIVHHGNQRKLSVTKMADVELRGIPVSEICATLGLPVHVIVGGSSKISLPLAFAWYKNLLARKKLEDSVHVGLVQITRRDNAEDGAPSLSDEEFLQHISTAVKSKSVMLLSFNVNIAHNVVIEAPPADPCHFAIVVGVDEIRGIVRVADVSVKKYRKTWHVPISRLYNASIGYGFIMVASEAALVAKLSSKIDAVMNSAKFKLPPSTPFSRGTFEFPRRNYSVTAIAEAFNRLGFRPTSVEDIVYNSGFHISFLLSEHVPMFDIVRIASHYSHTRLQDAVSIKATPIDSPGALSLQTFEKMLVQYAKSCAACLDAKKNLEELLAVNYGVQVVQENNSVWNGSNGGFTAFVVGYDTDSKIVTLSDTNPEAFYRVWTCPLELLYKACSQTDTISNRARGVIEFSSKSRQTQFDNTLHLDMRSAMSHHPFKPPLSTPAAAIALALSHLTHMAYSLEEVIYSSDIFKLTELDTTAKKPMAFFGELEHLAEAVIQRTNCPVSVKNITSTALASPTALAQAIDAMNKANGSSTTTLLYVLYRVGAIHFAEGQCSSPLATHLSSGIVNRCGDSTATPTSNVTLVDGNPTRYGEQWTKKVSELHGGAIGALLFTLK